MLHLRFRTRILPLVVASFACAATARADRVVDPAMHHVRWGPEREWDEFPERAEAAELVVSFDAKASATETSLRLRHRDVRRAWRVKLNGKDLGPLPPQDEAHLVTYLAVPGGTLRDGANELRVAQTDAKAPADDVSVGDVSLIDKPVAAATSEAALDVAVTDADSKTGLPCRITIVDDRGAYVQLGTPSGDGLAVRPGVVYTVDGRASIRLPAGRYTVYAGRGFEYSVASAVVDVKPDKPADVKLTIRRVVSTPGLVAADTHVHTRQWSGHGDATGVERAITLAGEGVELAVSAEHNVPTDYAEAVAVAGVAKHVTTVVGCEYTTDAVGHFNVFPTRAGAGRGPTLPDRRARDWAAVARAIGTFAAPPGPDGAPSSDGPVVILNHARDVHGGFRPFDPKRHVSVAGEDLDGWPMPANAMEVVNSGATMTDPMLLYRDWFGLLNRGLRVTPVGSSDSHDVSKYIVGQGRTYVRVPDGDPGRVDADAARRAMLEGRVLVSYGLLADVTVNGKFGPGDVVPAGELEVDVRVQGPEWVKATRVTLYANGVPVREETISAEAADKAGEKYRATWRLARPAHDVHLVAIATGPGVTAPYWAAAKPYQPTSSEYKPVAIGSTGAVWVDADGNGRFDAAIVYATRAVEAGGGAADVLKRLAGHDEAVAAQAAGLLWKRLGDDAAGKLEAAAKDADPAVAKGVRAYVAGRAGGGRGQ